MIQKLELFNLLIAFDKRYSFEEFRKASRVRQGTYAEELVERIYNCLFKYPRDLRKEYEQYYTVEYSDFGHFLYWRYKVDQKIAQKLQNKLKDNAVIFIGYGRDSVSGMFDDETVASVLKNILTELGDKSDENTD